MFVSKFINRIFGQQLRSVSIANLLRYVCYRNLKKDPVAERVRFQSGRVMYTTANIFCAGTETKVGSESKWQRKKKQGTSGDLLLQASTRDFWSEGVFTWTYVHALWVLPDYTPASCRCIVGKGCVWVRNGPVNVKFWPVALYPHSCGLSVLSRSMDLFDNHVKIAKAYRRRPHHGKDCCNHHPRHQSHK